MRKKIEKIVFKIFPWILLIISFVSAAEIDSAVNLQHALSHAVWSILFFMAYIVTIALQLILKLLSLTKEALEEFNIIDSKEDE